MSQELNNHATVFCIQVLQVCSIATQTKHRQEPGALLCQEHVRDASHVDASDAGMEAGFPVPADQGLIQHIL